MNFFPRCDFLRVIVATTLFGRLVDLENIELILEEFSQVTCHNLQIEPSTLSRKGWCAIGCSLEACPRLFLLATLVPLVPVGTLMLF